MALGVVSAGLLAACSAPAPAAQPAAAPTSAPKPAATTAPAAAPTAAPKPAAPAAVVPVMGGTVRIGVATEAGELDPHRSTGPITTQYARAMFNSLTRVDLAGNVQGELAESWSYSDPQTLTIKMRSGITFHDGTPFNAEAVKFNLERILDPATASSTRSELTGIKSMELVDPMTLRLTLTEPDVTLPARLSDVAGRVVAPSSVRQWGLDIATHPVGTGPFALAEWVRGDHLTLKRFANYWDKDSAGRQLPYAAELNFKPVTDPSVLLTNLRTSNLDIIQTILPSDIARVSADPTLAVVQGPGNIQTIWLNNEKPPFNNKALRQAVNFAIDREAIHRAIYFNVGSVGQYALRPESWAFNPAGSFYGHSTDRAKALLAAGGQPTGFKFTALIDNNQLDIQKAQAVKAQLATVGIEMDITPLEAPAHTSRRNGGDFEATFTFIRPQPDPDQNTRHYLRTAANINRSRYSNSKVDELFDKARTVADPNARKALYFEAQAAVLDDAPGVFLHYDADVKVMSASLQGYEPHNDTFIRFPSLWLKK
jgi:peptide/nickel transport system substrate-binding protein